LVLLVLIAAVVGKLLEIVLVGGLRRLIRRFFNAWDETFEKKVMKRVNLLFAAGLVGVLLPNIGLPVRFNLVLFVLVKLTVSVAAILIVSGILDLVFDAWSKVAAQTETKMDDQLIPLLRRAAKVLIFAIGGLFVLQNLDVDVGSLIAGLGLGGLAFALAAKDTLANLFGSFTIFADRPFQIGDSVSISGVEGSIEEVGFRSTRIRTFYGSLVTLPNSKVADALIDNLGKRVTRRIKTALSLTYATTPAQMQAFVEGVRASILASPWTKKDSFEVHFADMGASSLDVMVVCYSDSPGYRDYLEAKHHLMLEWMRLAEDLGVGFAFPTQTLHVESLAALDSVPEVQVPADEMLGQTVAGYGPDGERGTPRTPDVSAGFWPEEPEE
jgi:MscS family membrane protein